MKTALIIAAIVAASLYATDQHGTTTALPSLVVGDSRLTLTVPDTVSLGPWMVIRGKPQHNGTTASIAGYDVFTPEATEIQTEAEPIVAKMQDGRWRITFNAPGKH